ncbi:holin [Mycobacterium phage Marvin]|uniref:Holin n=5 Tax=Marvinvirus TaxID=1982091 RepID=A0A3S9U915_9CAUD|nr:holin [Mycobacterium phage Marvin]AYB70750.1 holin [Mycobacterium phage VasuNzinga]AZS06821.1 holin [Mycobacterium phage Raela]QFP94196.1 holin [Mycobacterium phage JoieB]QFP96920.1 holin [Mycobacterium phage Pringar]AEJ95338.1 hypothetical protein MARVIN_54 [Mycobacterium phage Marvin]
MNLRVLADKFLAAGKAFAGAFVGALASVLQQTATQAEGQLDGVKLPETEEEWVAFTIAVGVGFVLPYLVRNNPSVPKAQYDLERAQARLAAGKQVR